jgi:hypothetical protein
VRGGAPLSSVSWEHTNIQGVQTIFPRAELDTEVSICSLVYLNLFVSPWATAETPNIHLLDSSKLLNQRENTPCKNGFATRETAAIRDFAAPRWVSGLLSSQSAIFAQPSLKDKS